MGHQNAETRRRMMRLHDSLVEEFGSLSRQELFGRRDEVVRAAQNAQSTMGEAPTWYTRLADADRPKKFEQAFQRLLTALDTRL